MLLGSLVAVALLALLAAGRRAFSRRVELRVDAKRAVTADRLPSEAEPIRLDGGRHAILLLHGFGDSPQSLRFLANALHERRWTVSVPRLPGHGGNLQAFARSRAADWIAAARQELAALERGHETVVLAGLSMGGALATILASERQRPTPLILLAPYLDMLPMPRLVARTYPISALVTLPYLDSRTSKSILDPEASVQSIGYGVTTARLLHELNRVVVEARVAATKVRVPLLVVHSLADHRIPRRSAEQSFSLFASEDKTLEWVSRSGHVITVDYERERVAQLVVSWLEAHVSDRERPALATQNPPQSGELRGSNSA